jgi:hypothetical protein
MDPVTAVRSAHGGKRMRDRHPLLTVKVPCCYFADQTLGFIYNAVQEAWIMAVVA